MDIPEIEIPNFINDKYWLDYFPKKALNDLLLLDCAIDYRRSFITTNINPYFDSFIKWQFNKLNEKNYLKFGKKWLFIRKKMVSLVQQLIDQL